MIGKGEIVARNMLTNVILVLPLFLLFVAYKLRITRTNHNI